MESSRDRPEPLRSMVIMQREALNVIHDAEVYGSKIPMNCQRSLDRNLIACIESVFVQVELEVNVAGVWNEATFDC